MVEIAPGAALTLPPAPGYPGSFEAVQTLVASHEGRVQAFEAVVHADEATATVLLTMVNGPRLMEIVWDASGISETRSSLTPDSLSALNILADIVLANWPEAQVQAALPPGIKVEDNAGSRTIVSGDVILVEISAPAPAPNGRSRRTLRNLSRGYELTITSSNVAAGPDGFLP